MRRLKRKLLLGLVAFGLVILLLSLFCQIKRGIGEFAHLKKLKVNKTIKPVAYPDIQLTVRDIDETNKRCLFEVCVPGESGKEIITGWIKVGDRISFPPDHVFGDWAFLGSINGDKVVVKFCWAEEAFVLDWGWRFSD